MNGAFSTNPINSVTSPRNLSTSLPDFGSLLSSSPQHKSSHIEASVNYEQNEEYYSNQGNGGDGEDGGRRQHGGRYYNETTNFDYSNQRKQESFHNNENETAYSQQPPNRTNAHQYHSTSPNNPNPPSSQSKRTPEDDDPLNLKRKRISEMTADERVQWSRMQSRDHSRRSRLRRKQLEADLRVQIEQLQSFRTLIEDSYQLVSIHSLDNNAVFLYANSVYFRALNHIPQELIDMPIRELAHPDDIGELEKAITTIRTEEDSTPNVTLEWRIKVRENYVGETTSSYVHVISSISLNQQGIVLFSMIKNDLFSHSFSLEALSLVAARDHESVSDDKVESSQPLIEDTPISLTSV